MSKMRSITLKLDLYEYAQLEKVSKLAAEKLGLRKDIVEQDLEQLKELLEYYRDCLLYTSPSPRD